MPVSAAFCAVCCLHKNAFSDVTLVFSAPSRSSATKIFNRKVKTVSNGLQRRSWLIIRGLIQQLSQLKRTSESLWGENNFIVTWFVTFCFQTRFKEIIIMKPWNTIKEIFQMVLKKKKKLQRWVNSSVAALIGLTFTIPLSVHTFDKEPIMRLYRSNQQASAPFLIKGPSVPIPLMNSLIHTFIKSPGVPVCD